MRVSNHEEANLDLFHHFSQQQHTQHAKHKLVLVVFEAVVHLQIQGLWQWFSFRYLFQSRQKNIKCEIAVMSPLDPIKETSSSMAMNKHPCNVRLQSF